MLTMVSGGVEVTSTVRYPLATVETVYYYLPF